MRVGQLTSAEMLGWLSPDYAWCPAAAYYVVRRQLGTPPHPGAIDLATLALLSGHPLEQVHRMLFEPSPRWSSERRPACARCLARRGIHRVVDVAAADYQVACRRHQRWLHTSPDPQHQYDLRPIPEILTAQRPHRRLGHRTTAAHEKTRAFTEAQHVLFRWTAHGDWAEHRRRRLSHYIDIHRVRITEYRPLIAMVNYPETVALARLFIDPGWTEVAAWRGPAGIRRFSAHVRERLRIPYEPSIGRDPLLEWIDAQRRRPGR